MKKIFIASDHAGYNLKKNIINHFLKKNNFKDLGTFNSKKSVNYPDYAHKLCKKVSSNTKNIGILVCGSERAWQCQLINTKISEQHFVIQ